MSITVNGTRRELISGTTIQQLLQSLKMEPDRVAVELNRTILQKAHFEDTVLRDGDSVEIVHFVGGGGKSGARHEALGDRKKPSLQLQALASNL